MRSILIALWAVAARFATTKAQLPRAEFPANSNYCCVINFSDTACNQAVAEIDYSVSIPPNGDEVPIVNLPELLTTVRVIECDIAHPKLTLCSEKDCAGGQQWHGPGTPGCVNPEFFIQAVKVDWG